MCEANWADLWLPGRMPTNEYAFFAGIELHNPSDPNADVLSLSCGDAVWSWFHTRRLIYIGTRIGRTKLAGTAQ